MFRFLRLPPGLFPLLLALLFTACTRLDPPGPGQPLIVGLPTNPVFQQRAPPTEGMEGFSRDLTTLVAEALNVDVRYVDAPDYPTLLALVRDRKVHFAAAVPAQYGDPDLRFTSPLRETRQVIVQNANTLPVDAPEKLAGREITVMPGAPQIAALRTLNITPPPVITERSGIDELELLDRVARRHELAATDDLHFTVAANFNPDLSEIGRASWRERV